MDTQPFFLVGAERSGTTLLRLMLDHHPQLAFHSEFEYAVDHMTDVDTYPPLREYYQILNKNRFFLKSGFYVDGKFNYPQLVDSFLIQRGKAVDKPLVGATVHRHYHRLLQIWPKAKFIHLVRDPRDVARFCIHMGWAGNVWTGASRWEEAEQLWDQVSSTLDEGQTITITYEDLVSQPHETLGAICHFAKIPFSEEMLRYPNDSTYSPVNSSLAWQWKDKLSQREVQLVEARVGELMEQRGYTLSEYPSLSVGFIRRAILKVQNKISCVRHRLKRYGLPLITAHAVARRFLSKRLCQAVEDRVWQVTQQHIK